MQLWSEAKEDCMWMAYFLCFIGPLHSFLVLYLENKGKKVSTFYVFVCVAGLTIFSTLLPLYVRRYIQSDSPYRLLGVSRYGDKYGWAQQYAAWKQYFVNGKISQEQWTRLDSSYDILYDNNARHGYDSWGPDFQVQLQDDLPFNVGLYYFLWSAGVYISTVGRKYQSGRDVSIAMLLAVLVFEMSVRLFGYDPRMFMFSQTTPYELYMSVHIIFPAILFGYNSFKRLHFVDMIKHRNDCLQYALQNNHNTFQTLKTMTASVLAEKAAQIEKATNEH